MSGKSETTRKPSNSNLPTARTQDTHTIDGELAQLGERLVCNQEVTGSSPVFSTRLRAEDFRRRFVLVGREVAKARMSTDGLFGACHAEAATRRRRTQCEERD